MVQINIYRNEYLDKQVLGSATVFKDNKFAGTFATLEKPWKDNEKMKSCIPPGNYNVEHWDSKNHPNSFRVKDVKDRSYILIHKGNIYQHSQGCILLGGFLKDINNDGLKDIIYSKKAMALLNIICKNETDIKLRIS